MRETAAARLAEWALGLRLDEVAPSVRRAAALHMLDGIGVALAAANRGEGGFGARVARTFTAPAESTVIGGGFGGRAKRAADPRTRSRPPRQRRTPRADGTRVPAPMAALANGALVHALDYDDTHTGSLCHPTSVVLPAVLAVGEASGASGAEALVAAVAAYETIARIGAAVLHGFHARGFHATSVCGVFAAALAAARLTGLDRDTTVNALGIAGSQAAGSLEFLHAGASTKQLHPGWAAHSGILAARLAEAGASGPASILEGEYGLYRSFTGVEVDAGAIADELGSRWETPAIAIKTYPACQLFHTSLDALAAVREELGGRRIERLTFDVPREAVPIVCEPRDAKVRPRTPYEGKFSLPFSAAVMLVDGRVGLGSYDALERPEVLELAGKVGYLATDPGVPPGDAGGRVEVVLRGGETVVGTAPGGGREATEQAVVAKLRSHGLPDTDALEKAVLGLEDAPSLGGVIDSIACF